MFIRGTYVKKKIKHHTSTHKVRISNMKVLIPYQENITNRQASCISKRRGKSTLNLDNWKKSQTVSVSALSNTQLPWQEHRHFLKQQNLIKSSKSQGIPYSPTDSLRESTPITWPLSVKFFIKKWKSCWSFLS